ncbi:unnamed protein product [Brassica napus]|uniref:(rape) hypothetical protein n=1 Tax=Brassica napus TaxID=3708 RepID=A0A816M7R8_BRANA|nr:unnamed protein product [Brassica napus]
MGIRSDIHIHRRHDLDGSQLRSIISRYLEDSYGSLLFWRNKRSHLLELVESEKAVLLGQSDVKSEESGVVAREDGDEIESGLESLELEVVDGVNDSGGKGLLSISLSKYTTVTLPDDDERSGWFSMAQLLGFLGLFNFFIFLPAALILNFTKRERFNALTLKQLSLVVGKGLLDNVLSDYLWAKAVLLTTTTVASAGLTIQVLLAAIVDSLSGNKPSFTDFIGAAAVMVGFAGINIPAEVFHRSKETSIELEPVTSFTDPPQIVSDSIRVDSSETQVS